MTKTLFKQTVALATAMALFLQSKVSALAAITNPAVGALGDDATKAASGETFTTYFIYIWRGLIAIGALTVLVYFVWAGVEWISAGGDSSKVQKARDRMIQSVIGMILLVGSFVIIELINTAFFGEYFDLLNFTV